ncbi:LuxR C-terminal-related transcriptional regulator [Streptomyces sp. JL2001]|uniref:LuxR C-terminal-related transcriptional regulator n=1 Tax=Streptomyces sp. JL2001 TaxID=3342488 RepID=UPI003D807FCF
MKGDVRPLIGREEELAAVRRLLPARGSGPALVELAGDPGTGKTRLLGEIAALAAEAGVRVRGVRPAELPATGLPSAGPAEPLLLLVDDVHGGGPEAERALLAVLRTPPAEALLLVLAHRPRQCPPALRAELTAARGTWRTAHLDLADLDRTATGTFPAQRLCHRHHGSLYDRTGGNPRLLELLEASCAGPGACPEEEPADEAAARRAAAPLLAEVTALSADARLVAHAAAVLGEPAGPDLLADVAGLAPGRVLAAVDELLAADLLRPAPAPGQVAYRHPLVGRVVYGAVPGGWRLGAHARACARHRADGVAPVRYARHLEQSCATGDASGAAVLTAAAEAALPGDPATADRWFRAADRLLHDTPAHRNRRRAALAGAAAAAVMTGRTDRARAALERRDQLLDGPDHTPEAAGAALCRAAIAQSDGDLPLARSVLRTALSTTAAEHPHGAAALWIALAATACRDAEPEARDWADEAVLAAAGSGDEAAQVHALALHGTVRLAGGTAAAARRDAVAAARLADALGDRALALRLDALDCLARLETDLERYGPAVRHLNRGLAIGRAAGQWPAVASMAAGLATVLLRQGRPAEAAAPAEEAVRCSELVGGTELRAMALCLRARVALDVHEPETAVAVARAACVVAAPDGHWARRARMALAAGQLAAGDALGSLETLAGAGLTDPAATRLPHPTRLTLAEILCAARLAAGRPDAARLAAGEAATVAAELGLAGARARAALLGSAAAEEPAEALRLAEDALVAAAESGHLADEGWARTAAARALAALGEPDQAERHLAAADAVAAGAGASRLAAAVTRAREAARPPLAAGTVTDGTAESAHMLSQREFEISTLVSQGCTNRQIARTLGVSHKTVETHLGRIFAKLEVSSRAEIANMIGRNTVVARPRARAKALAVSA